MIVWALAGACGGGGANSTVGTGTGTGTGAATEGTQTDSSLTGTTEVTPTGEPTGGTGGVSDATTLNPTNAFTDSSQLTEGPAETGPGEPPPHMCEAAGPCIAPEGCAACAIANDCADEYAACLAVPNNECTLYSDCVNACAGDAMCAQNCYLAYPNGYDPAWALGDCTVCDVCPIACSYYETYCATGGGGPGKTETCDAIGECESCSGCSVYKDCAPVVQDCASAPECQPYLTCIQGCAAEDGTCYAMCEGAYPNGYDPAWALFDCALCTACPTSCATAQPYCQAGGGGPDIECLTDEDCVEIYEYQTYCLNNGCVECKTDDDCLEPDFPTCVGNFCE